MNTPAWVVTSVRPTKEYTLELSFADGKRKVCDARPLLDKPLYAPLRSLPFFLGAQVQYGTVVWSDDLDIAPEWLYEHGQE